jgi:hypothetical protein
MPGAPDRSAVLPGDPVDPTTSLAPDPPKVVETTVSEPSAVSSPELPGGVGTAPTPSPESPISVAPEVPVKATGGQDKKPTLGQTLVMAGGALMFIWGFLDWFSGGGTGANAFSGNTVPGLRLTGSWVPLLSLSIAILMAIKVFGDVLPDEVWDFSWQQLSLIVGAFDTLITFGFLVANRNLGGLAHLNLGIGLILSFLTALVLLTGAILDHVGVGKDVFTHSGA